MAAGLVRRHILGVYQEYQIANKSIAKLGLYSCSQKIYSCQNDLRREAPQIVLTAI